jgi:predicted acetyltransferase
VGRAQEPAEFAFYDPGSLVDGDLGLVLEEQYPGNPVRGWVPAYRFKMLRTASGAEMGRIELRVGDTLALQRYSGHIGYHVRPRFRGHRYAARACRLLLPLARRHGMIQLWITCNPDNLASRRTCELAGAEFVEIVDLPKDSDMYRRGERQKCRYRLDLTVGVPGPVSAGAALAELDAPDRGE